jgi:hypothetical protein
MSVKLSRFFTPRQNQVVGYYLQPYIAPLHTHIPFSIFPIASHEIPKLLQKTSFCGICKIASTGKNARILKADNLGENVYFSLKGKGDIVE